MLMESNTPQKLSGEMTTLLERTRAVAQASLQSERTDADETNTLTEAMIRVSTHAPLYFRWIIPNWPPHLLLRKILRRVMIPFWMGQVHFNEASRDSLRGLVRRMDRQHLRASEQQKQIDALKREIADLHVLVQQVTTAGNSASDTAPDETAGPSPLELEAMKTAWPVIAARVAEKIAHTPGEATVSPLFFNGLDDDKSGLSSDDAKKVKPRLAFVAPFPPAQTGVADYSVEILDPLRLHYDLDLYTENGYAPRLAPPFIATPLSSWDKNVHLLRRDYQSVVYQMGNNGHYHQDAYQLLMRYAGITVLHDYLLAHMMTYFCMEATHLSFRLDEELAYEIGHKKADVIISDINSGKMSHGEFATLGIPMNRRVFTRSLGVVLHNQWSYEQAQKDRANDNDLITLIPPVIPPVALDQTDDELHALRKRLGVPVDAFVIAPCGIVTETKRPYATLDAFQKLLPERPDAFLLFVGSVLLPTNKDFGEEIKKRGLIDRVKVTGYVGIPLFNEYLLIADVCVTLRFPSQGETSGALLRMLVHGKPSIVTAIGSFDDFPDDTVHKLPTPDKMTDEVGEILQAFRLMANDKAYREKVGATGLAYVLREHSPERCALLYARFVDEVMAHPTTRKKLIADWAGRDIARRAQTGTLPEANMLAILEQSLMEAAPKVLHPPPVQF